MTPKIHLEKHDGPKEIYHVVDWKQEGGIIKGITKDQRYRYFPITQYKQVWVEESNES